MTSSHSTICGLYLFSSRHSESKCPPDRRNILIARLEHKNFATDIDFLVNTFINIVLRTQHDGKYNFHDKNNSNNNDSHFEIPIKIFGPHTDLMYTPYILGLYKEPNNLINQSKHIKPKQKPYRPAIKVLKQEHTQNQQKQDRLQL